MKEVGSKAASVKLKMPKRMLNILGEINYNAYSVIANDPKRIAKLRSITELADSIDSIKNINAEDKDAKDQAKEDSMRKEIAPKGLEKLQNGEELDKLSTVQLQAISLVYMHTPIKSNIRKQACVDAFKSIMAKTKWTVPPQPSTTQNSQTHNPQNTINKAQRYSKVYLQASSGKKYYQDLQTGKTHWGEPPSTI